MKFKTTYAFIVSILLTVSAQFSSAGGADTGGGSTFNGKPLESYMRSVKNFDSYREYVAPILENIKKSGNDILYNFLNYTIESKNWFFIPARLESIPKELLGLAVKTDQGILQSFTNLIVDSKIWENPRMTSKDQAVLIVHEMWMGMKIAQFASSYLQCMHSRNSIGQQQCKDHNKTDFTKISLTSEDYKQVQKLTEMTFEQSANLSKEQWSRLVNSNDFEFNWRFFETENQKSEMPWASFIQMLKFGDSTGRNPTHGYNLARVDDMSPSEIWNKELYKNYITKEDCQISVNESEKSVDILVSSPSFNHSFSVPRTDEVSFKPIFISGKSDFLRGFLGMKLDQFPLGYEIKSDDPNRPNKYMNVVLLSDFMGIAGLQIQEMTCKNFNDKCQGYVDVYMGKNYFCSRVKNPFGFPGLD